MTKELTPKSWSWATQVCFTSHILLFSPYTTFSHITGVGKTSLLHRYTQNKFDPKNTTSTTGAFFVTKKVYVDGLKVRLQLWDTAGQERFRSMVCHSLSPHSYISYQPSSRPQCIIVEQTLLFFYMISRTYPPLMTSEAGWRVRFLLICI
jgi:hypothetical protein